MMRGSRALLAAALLVVVLAVGAAPAAADERTCQLDPESQELRCRVVASPAPSKTVALGDTPLVWRRLPLETAELLSRGLGCVRDNAGVTEIGAGYVITLVNQATSELLLLRYVCQWPGDPAPQPPPDPPTSGELVQANANVLTLEPSLSPNRTIGGLTGLDSWLWCTDPGPVAVAVSLRGWTAAGSIQLVHTQWDVTGPSDTSITSTSCGSADGPAGTWTPETMGDHTVTLISTWAGTWDLTWNGITTGTFPLGPLAIPSASIPYPVDEYRGRLTE